MIDALILIGAGGIIAVLAIVAIIAIRANNRLEWEKAILKTENRMLEQERNELKARATALQEAMEARPTQAAKRTVRKNSAQATES